MSKRDRIRSFFAGARHADLIILAASFCLLLLFFAAELLMHQRTPKDIYSPQLRCLLLVLICAVSYLGGRLYAQRTENDTALRVLIRIFFALYLYQLLSLTLFDKGMRLDADRLMDTGLTRRQYYMKWFVNFRPFQSIYTVYIRGLLRGYVSIRYTLLNLLGNLCAFMPFAFFLPCFFKRMRHWYCFVPAVIGTVALVEGTQLWLMVGSCDIDDLILNAGGAVLLYFLLRIPPLRRLCEKTISVQAKTPKTPQK